MNLARRLFTGNASKLAWQYSFIKHVLSMLLLTEIVLLNAIGRVWFASTAYVDEKNKPFFPLNCLP